MGMLLLGAGGSTVAVPAGMTIRQITPLVTGNTVDTSRTLVFPAPIDNTGMIVVCAAIGAEGSSGASDSDDIITGVTMTDVEAFVRAHGRPMSSGLYGTDVWYADITSGGETDVVVAHLNDVHCSMFAIELTAEGTLATPVGSENYSDTSPSTGAVSGIPASNGIAILTVYNDPWGHPATPVFTAPAGYTKQVEYTTIDSVIPVFVVFTKLTTGSATETAEYTMTNPSAYGQIGSLVVFTI